MTRDTQQQDESMSALKLIALVLSIVVPILGAAIAVHAKLILPQVLSEAQSRAEMMDSAALELHTRNPHPGSVSRREFEMFLEQDRRQFQVMTDQLKAVRDDLKDGLKLIQEQINKRP